MQGYNTYQPRLFSYVDIETLIPPNHILRKIDRVFDLSFVRRLTEPYYCSNNGRPSIDPELFFRMVLIGYIFGIGHDRRLCDEITYNLAYRWYCRLNLEDSVPDHSTLSKIRDRYGEEVFESVFSMVVEICRKHGLVKGERIITDSTLIEADASVDSMVPRDPDLTDEENTSGYREDITAPLPSKKISNKTHVSSTDPDSSLAQKAGTPRTLKYKVHTSLDADSRVIIDNKVTTGGCHDSTIYLGRLEHIKKKYAIPLKEAVGDRGYGTTENLKVLNGKGIKTYIPLFSTRSGQNDAKVAELGFIYDKGHDRYECPAGKYLEPCHINERAIIYRAKSQACKACHLKVMCPIKNRKRGMARCIFRSLNQDFYEEQMQRMKEPAFQDALRERMWKIEGINAEAKNLHGLKRARYRSLVKVQIQAYMVAVTQNLKRLANLFFGTFLLNIGRILNILAKFKLQDVFLYNSGKNLKLTYKIAS